MRSDDYKRGYKAGYSAGRTSCEPSLIAERQLALDAAQRAERAESAKSIGHCDECFHWIRGGLGNYAHKDVCAWGVCNIKRAAGTPWGTRMWADDSNPVTTTPKFGCVLFAAISQSSPQAGEGGGV